MPNKGVFSPPPSAPVGGGRVAQRDVGGERDQRIEPRVQARNAVEAVLRQFDARNLPPRHKIGELADEEIVKHRVLPQRSYSITRGTTYRPD